MIAWVGYYNYSVLHTPGCIAIIIIDFGILPVAIFPNCTENDIIMAAFIHSLYSDLQFNELVFSQYFSQSVVTLY